MEIKLPEISIEAKKQYLKILDTLVVSIEKQNETLDKRSYWQKFWDPQNDIKLIHLAEIGIIETISRMFEENAKIVIIDENN